MATATANPASKAAAPTEQITGQLAEYHVFSELLKRSVAVYQPLVNEGIDALVRLPDGQTLELAIKAVGVPAEQYPRRFLMPDYRPRPELFIVCVDLSEGVENVQAWVFPSLVFYAYSPRPGSKRKNRILNLDSGEKKIQCSPVGLPAGFPKPLGADSGFYTISAIYGFTRGIC